MKLNMVHEKYLEVEKMYIRETIVEHKDKFTIATTADDGDSIHGTQLVRVKTKGESEGRVYLVHAAALETISYVKNFKRYDTLIMRKEAPIFEVTIEDGEVLETKKEQLKRKSTDIKGGIIV